MQKDTDLFEVLKDLSSDYSHKFIMGDLNADLSLASDADAHTIRILAKNLNLQIMQHGPTYRHTPNSYTWIDLIILDENDEVLDYKNECLASFGKHAIIDVTINTYVSAPVRGSFSYRDYKNICPNTLNDLLARCDWVGMNSIESDLEGALRNLNSNLNLIIDQLAPLKSINIRKKFAPWLGPELRQLIDKRDATHRCYKRTGRAALLGEFLWLSSVDIRITRKRNSFLHRHLTDTLDANKDIWKEMRNVGLLPKRKEEDLNGFTPEELNAHFAGISVSTFENIEELTDAILSANEDGFSFKPVNLTEVILAISHFSSQAKGVDGVPQSVVVKALLIIGNYITNIFNSSYAEGILPGSWKQAQIIVLKKKVAPLTASDFHPIALPYFLSKVLEKIAQDQLTEYLNSNNLLDPFQAGFRRHQVPRQLY